MSKHWNGIKERNLYYVECKYMWNREKENNSQPAHTLNKDIKSKIKKSGKLRKNTFDFSRVDNE